MSRRTQPKQFLRLVGKETMLQQAARRAAAIRGAALPLVICHADHRFMVADQMYQATIRPGTILLEPCSRHTAPAAALAALHLIGRDPEAIMLLLPADHVIGDTAAFTAAVEIARQAAGQGHLVAFGIVPDRPETGYGYIKRGMELEGVSSAYSVDTFVEKPDLDSATRYVTSGNYLWNSGMFALPASLYLAELERLRPDVLLACRSAVEAGDQDRDFFRIGAHAFESCPFVSIDYAVMEHTDKGMVVPTSADWSDLGTWHALWEAEEKDASGNVIKGRALIEDSHNSYVYCDNGSIVAAVGLQGMVVVATKDAVLVAPRSRAEDVSTLVQKMTEQDAPEVADPPVMPRPWGTYENLDISDGFRVKRITVKPGGRLSLQRHRHRSEHWVVVKGTAHVTVGDEVSTLTEDKSIYIPVHEIHRLENLSDQLLELIEVQFGDYLGEDDIERLEDVYARD